MSMSKIGPRRQVVIPKQVCDAVGIRAGDIVEVRSTRGSVVIKPRKRVARDDSLTPGEERIVLKGEGQLRRGQYIDLDDLNKELDRPARARRRKTA